MSTAEKKAFLTISATTFKYKSVKGTYLWLWSNEKLVEMRKKRETRLSQTLSFLQIPSFRQAQYALIGQLTQSIVIGQTPQARVGNVTPLTIIASFSFQNKCKDI